MLHVLYRFGATPIFVEGDGICRLIALLYAGLSPYCFRPACQSNPCTTLHVALHSSNYIAALYHCMLGNRDELSSSAGALVPLAPAGDIRPDKGSPAPAPISEFPAAIDWKPAATTVTLILPLSVSSITAPNMMLASLSAIEYTTSAAVCTSCRVRSLPPLTFTTTPDARAKGNSSRGDATAISAASCARDLPEDMPTPSNADPELDKMDRTSAKSTFTSPGTVIMSEMPWTP
mmetsp:Transcript_15578/g.25801  ORF Transcript_15578/g.25801 Transcript_15578/m.25801 type:complete len:233 (-) Transcript_15578:1045-1743(-)